MSTYASILPHSITDKLQHDVRVSGTPEVSPLVVGIAPIPKGTVIGDGFWRLGLDLIVEIRREGSNIVAIDHSVDEYGVGKSSEEALADLLLSLVDYRLSLEKRENRLAAKERGDLTQLRRSLERQ